MRKIITTISNGVVKTEPVSDDESYDAFHAAISVMVGDLAAQNEGLTGLNIRLSDGDGPADLGVANFYFQEPFQIESGRFLAEINLVAE